MQQVSSWLNSIQWNFFLDKFTASNTPINLFFSSSPSLNSTKNISQPQNLHETWVLSNVYALRRHPKNDQPRRPWKRFHVKMHQRILKQQLFSTLSRWRQSQKNFFHFIDSFLISFRPSWFLFVSTWFFTDQKWELLCRFFSTPRTGDNSI